MASTTFLDNQTVIYAAWLNDVNNAVYNGIFVSPSITATSMICNGTASGAGFTNLINNSLSAPGAIGSATPNTGAFTTLTSTTLNTTAITGLTTPLSRAQGGTGLSAAGTSGNVLTSNGTNWTSAAAPYFGVNQTWQDLTGSRAAGTTYTNTTGKPIMVFVRCGGSFLSASILADVIEVGFARDNTAGASIGLSGIIPPGYTYILNIVNGGLTYWAELR
jgi:hypothetical protein